MSPINVRELEQRSRQYWRIDGIPVLVLGAMWILWGGALLIGEALPRGGPWRVYWLVVPAVLVLSGVAANRLTTALKQQLTFPRTGYVVLPEPGPAARVMAAAVAIGGAAAVAALIVKGRATGVERTTPAAIGVLLSLAFLVASVRQRSPDLLALAGVALMLGIAIGTLGLGWPGMNWMLVGLGIAAASLGGWRLARYLRRHPREAR